MRQKKSANQKPISSAFQELSGFKKRKKAKELALTTVVLRKQASKYFCAIAPVKPIISKDPIKNESVTANLCNLNSDGSAQDQFSTDVDMSFQQSATDSTVAADTKSLHDAEPEQHIISKPSTNGMQTDVNLRKPSEFSSIAHHNPTLNGCEETIVHVPQVQTDFTGFDSRGKIMLLWKI